MKVVTLLPLVILLGGCFTFETKDIPSVRNFDAARYMGKWYEYARLPNSFENGMTDVYAEYSLENGGKVKVVNTGFENGKKRSITGVARFAGQKDTGELLVSFFRPFYGRYRIVWLNKDYTCAVVTGASKEYLWILTRTPAFPPEMGNILSFLKSHGYAVERLIYPHQKP